MANAQSIGKCEYCSAEFSKSSMGRHLKSCLAKNSSSAKVAKTTPMLHLAIEGQYIPEYWIHIETAAQSTFGNLDAYLRDLWLECCGHLSGFRFPEPKGMRTFLDFDMDAMLREERRLMATKLGSRLKVGDKFEYDYDFGSTTTLKVKVVAERDGTGKKGRIKLLARNLPPDLRCECGQPAASVCTQCKWDGNVYVCKACGLEHECGDEMFLPILNSPRMGVCGYVG